MEEARSILENTRNSSKAHWVAFHRRWSETVYLLNDAGWITDDADKHIHIGGYGWKLQDGTITHTQVGGSLITCTLTPLRRYLLATIIQTFAETTPNVFRAVLQEDVAKCVLDVEETAGVVVGSYRTSLAPNTVKIDGNEYNSTEVLCGKIMRKTLAGFIAVYAQMPKDQVRPLLMAKIRDYVRDYSEAYKLHKEYNALSANERQNIEEILASYSRNVTTILVASQYTGWKIPRFGPECAKILDEFIPHNCEFITAISDAK